MFGKKSGGMGGYAEYSFGKAGNFMANYTYGVSLSRTNTAIAISAVGYGSRAIKCHFITPISIALCTIFTLWLATVLNLVEQESLVTSALLLCRGVIIPVVGICLIG